MQIRKARKEDLSRIAEIYVFNNRITYYPIFKDITFSFGKLQVSSLIDEVFSKKEVLRHLYVFEEEEIIKGFLQVEKTEICKLYVDPFFQGKGVGKALMRYAVKEHQADRLWALEKNSRAIAFYERCGFHLSAEKELEEGTSEYLVRLRR